MPRDPFHVALIGYGLAGACFHAPFIATTPGLRLTMIVTRDPERRRQAAREHPQARIVPDADALWRAAGNLDLVVVASPNRTHVPFAHAALDAGLSVVVDKPIAATAEQARELAARSKPDAFVTVFQNRRWDGDFLTLRRLLDEQRLGAEQDLGEARGQDEQGLAAHLVEAGGELGEAGLHARPAPARSGR